MRLSWLAALCLLLSSPGAARPYTVEDMLRLENYGQVAVHPSGAYAIVERQGAWDSAPRFAYGGFTHRSVTKLYRLDLKDGQQLVPLFEQEASGGYWMAGLSPSGRKLAVYRLKDDRLSAGIVELATGKVRWLSFAPDLPPSNAVPIWLDDQQLIYPTLPTGDLPFVLGLGSSPQKRAMRLWEKAAGGREAAATTLGAGRFANAGLDDTGRGLILFDLSTNNARTLFQGAIGDFALAADRQHIAILFEGDVARHSPDTPLGLSTKWRRQRLAILNLASGKSWSPCNRCDALSNLLAWSPTGAELLVFARKDGDEWERGELYRARVADESFQPLTGPAIRPLLERPDPSAIMVRAAWVGAVPIVLGSAPNKSRGDWYRLGRGEPRRLTAALPSAPSGLLSTSDASLRLLSEGRLWTVDLRARATAGPWTHVDAPNTARSDPFAAGIRHVFNDPPRRAPALIAAGPTAASRRVVDPEAGTDTCDIPAAAQVLATHPRAGAAVGLNNQGGSARLLRMACGKPAETVDRINSHLTGIERARTVKTSTQGKSGEQLTHWLFLPPTPATRLAPLVVIPYPGLVLGEERPPHSGFGVLFPAANAELLASRGYAVLMPSLPLAWGAGDPLLRLSDPVLAAVDAAAATGLIDPSRLAIYGHSYGGYGAVGVGTQTDRFRAIIASAGPCDLVSGYGSPVDYPENERKAAMETNFAAGFYERGQFRMGAPPWRDLDRYIRNSPYFAVEKIKSPVLLIHGDIDAVPVQQAERMFFALYRAGKDALLVRYGGEGHVFTSPANIEDQWEQIFGFLDRIIGGPNEGSLTDPR